VSIPEATAAACLVLLGVTHSYLGETDILRPLFRAEWTTMMPRWALERILRFAWHLTSIAWLAMAAILLGVGAVLAIGLMSMVSAALIFVALRGHFAWPLFLLAGLVAFYADGRLDTPALAAGALATTTTLFAASALHVWWAMGGSWMLDKALPSTSDGRWPRPGRWETLAVAIALVAFGALVALAALGEGPGVVRWLVAAGVVVLTLRAVGDTKVAGFTKTVRDTDFAKADDKYFTPLVVFLALGASGALLLN
jgi:Protein of unknown function (DUF3995)